MIFQFQMSNTCDQISYQMLSRIVDTTPYPHPREKEYVLEQNVMFSWAKN